MLSWLREEVQEEVDELRETQIYRKRLTEKDKRVFDTPNSILVIYSSVPNKLAARLLILVIFFLPTWPY